MWGRLEPLIDPKRCCAGCNYHQNHKDQKKDQRPEVFSGEQPFFQATPSWMELKNYNMQLKKFPAHREVNGDIASYLMQG